MIDFLEYLLIMLCVTIVIIGIPAFFLFQLDKDHNKALEQTGEPSKLGKGGHVPASKSLLRFSILLALAFIVLSFFLYPLYSQTYSFCTACIKGDVSRVKKMIKRGVDINDDGMARTTTPLMCASRNGHVEIVNLLVENGADIDFKDPMNCTALYYAVSSEHVEIIEILLKHKANVNIPDKDGETVLDHARGNEKIVELLKAHGAKTKAVLEAEKSDPAPGKTEDRPVPKIGRCHAGHVADKE